MKNRSQKKGFTLIELIVACAIIAMITAIVIANLTVSKAKANDGSRRVSIRQIEKALELYYADHRAYPLSISNPDDRYACNYQSKTLGLNVSTSLDWIPDLAPEYISTLPKDPLEGTLLLCSGSPTYYAYKSCDGENYALTYVCAMQEGVISADKLYTPTPPNSIKLCRGDLGCSSSGTYSIQ